MIRAGQSSLEFNMKRPAIFFDRDNTLIANDGFLGDPEKVVLIDGAANAIAKARSLGFATVVISNQSGVAHGLFGEEDVHEVNTRLDELLKAANPAAVIDRHEFCPYHPEATVEQYKQDSSLRKPKPGMILAAAQRLALDLSRSWVIGDAPRDIEAGKAAGCRTILIHQPDLPASPAASEKLSSQPEQIVSNLAEAMDFIQKQIDAEAAASIPVAAVVPTTPAPTPQQPMTRLEQLTEQILFEMRKAREHGDYPDFAVSKLLAGIVQVLALAVVFLSYLYRNDESFSGLLLFAVFMQTLTISLLIMGKQK
jgi:D-glycero-D-manno-heptose 1,7-bisphosphate phosphatase